MKRKTILVFLVAALTVTLLFSPYLPCAKAAYVEIISILPTTHRAEVGNKVLIIGTTNTTDGLCTIWFDRNKVNETQAVGNEVNVTFIVPLLPEGNHTITLRDETTKNNATTGLYIITAYYIEPELPQKPKQIQQNDSVTLNLTITGGEPNSSYDANVTVELPAPLNTTAYSALVKISTNDKGYGSTEIMYPNETMFEPSGSNTNYTGHYSAYFDKFKDRAKTSFFIGLTDASEYHREDLVSVTALEYTANKTASIIMTSLETNDAVHSLEVNVTQRGIVQATWMVPSNASIGNYSVTISVENETKPIEDSQIIRVPGYLVEVYTQNLALDGVPQILVEALDEATNMTYSNTTEANALTHLSLEKGNHTLEAYWKDVRVNQTEVVVTGNRTYNLTCELTNMRITVEDEERNRLPFVHLDISYQFNTTKQETMKNGSATGRTDISGVFSLNSTLPRIVYNIDASRYGRIFNRNNNTVEYLPVRELVNVTILCPAKTLTLNITDYHGKPIPNAQVQMIEQMGGIHYSETADIHGTASINCTFGRYSVAIYKDNLFLNETLTDLFNDTKAQIHCKLYNLTFTVKIVDYFGQLIPVGNVTLQRNGLQYLPSTKSDGTVKFSNIVGGKLQINIYIRKQDQPSVVKELYIDSPSPIEIKIAKYVSLAGTLVETSQLATALIIVLAILLVVSLELHRRKKPQITE